ncbi:MAG: UDPGP type 1 family protein [Planctomycetaceae bacterium]|nr:UDPGP type 1 family protein [Planctomycetales bacterium]MCB9922705.1 UDPGP type 1 family protein [Planctomycetaceae bacterium]
MKHDELAARLETFGQQHVLAFWEQLDATQRKQLSNQVEAIDFELLSQLVQGSDAAPDWAALAAKAEPPRAIRIESSDNEFSQEEATARGEQSLREGQLGLILVAGGQGTRLGFDHPKGMFPLGPVSNRTLFQILIERLRAVARRYGASIPLYLMTSPATHEETISFLSEHDRFGLGEDELRVFCQGVMPAVDAATGRLLLADRDSLALSPDGHGGTLAAFIKEGCMADAQQRNIEHLFYCHIDNPLVQICDPQMIGYHLLSGSEMTSQAVKKRAADEKVGNVVTIDGVTQIIEYSDLPTECGAQTQDDGSLKLWAGSIGVHVFRRSFLERAAGRKDSLPFHRALKAVPHIAADGSEVTPQAPNAIKFERFIFDLLPLAKNAIVIEVDASDAFAPVKNAEGEPTDSPTTARAAMVARDAKLLRNAGARIEEGVAVEVSPLWAMDASEAATKVPKDEVRQAKYFAQQ